MFPGRKWKEIILKSLSELNNIPPRNHAKAQEGKSRFIAQAKLISKSPITYAPESRHNKWNLSKIKERKMGTVVTVILVLGLVFGGSTATVYAAQDSAPEQFLYPVKLLTEDINLELSDSAETKMELSLKYALRRIDEIKELQELGQMPPDAVFARLENHINLALQQAASLGNDEATKALLQIRDTLQTREQLLNQQSDDPILLRTREILQERIQTAESGIADPEGLYNEFRAGWDSTPPVGEATEPPGNGQSGQDGMVTTPAGNGDQYGNPTPAHTPQPGTGYGIDNSQGDSNPGK